MEKRWRTDQENKRERSILPCDFRASGLLSQESTRQLRSMHETFARALSHSLDLFLGSPLELKLLRLDQLGAREYAASLAPGSYLVPFGLQPLSERAVARFDNGLLFPLLDLLLGGSGDPLEMHRELTEIDEELFRSVTELMAAQLERVWRACSVSVAPLPSVKLGLLSQMFAIEERVVVLHFEIRLAGWISFFSLVLPMTFSSALVRHMQDEATRQNGVQRASKLRLRDRVLNCMTPLAMELPELQVPIRDLISLKEGTLLDLRAPVDRPILLRTEGHPVFRASPVRRGAFKAAHIETIHHLEE